MAFENGKKIAASWRVVLSIHNCHLHILDFGVSVAIWTWTYDEHLDHPIEVSGPCLIEQNGY